MPFQLAQMVAFAFLAGPATSFAAHPLVTDDTGTQGIGNDQIEINTDRARTSGAWQQIGALTYSHGVAPALDLYVNLPATLSAPRGIGDVSLGAKWRFREGATSSLGLKSELLLPTGSDYRGLGNGRTSAAFTLIGSVRGDPWTFHANLSMAGYRYRLPVLQAANREYVWRASAAAVYALRPGWSLVADAGIVRNVAADVARNPIYLLGAVIYSPTKNVDLDAGLKTGWNAAQVDRQFGVGLTARF